MTSRLSLPLVLLTCGGSLAASESTTIDIRALGGMANGSGHFAAIALESTSYGGAAEFGPRDQALVGLAGELRLQLNSLEVEAGGKSTDVDLTGGSLGLGLGMWLSRPLTIEVLGRFGTGFSSSRGGVSFDSNDGDYTMWGVAVSVDWTLDNRLQFIGEIGFSQYELTFHDASGKHTGTGDGLDLGVGMGYRF